MFVVSYSSFDEEAGSERRIKEKVLQVSSELKVSFSEWSLCVADSFDGQKQGGGKPWELL